MSHPHSAAFPYLDRARIMRPDTSPWLIDHAWNHRWRAEDDANGQRNQL